MKKVLFILLILCSCSEPRMSTWEIERKDGSKDTLEARDFWVMSADSMFIKFELTDSTRIVYSRAGIAGFRKIKP